MNLMKTVIVKIDKNQIDEQILARAGEILKQGGLVAFPTETVYGLGANGLNEEAVRKIFKAKGRPADNPLILHIYSVGHVEVLVKNIPETAERCMEEFWPGPLTILFKIVCFLKNLKLSRVEIVHFQGVFNK